MRYIPYGQDEDYQAIADAAGNPDTPATEVDKAHYTEMLNCMPPIWQRSARAPLQFAVSEEVTSRNGEPVYLFLGRVSNRYYAKYGVLGRPETLIGYNADTTPYTLAVTN